MSDLAVIEKRRAVTPRHAASLILLRGETHVLMGMRGARHRFMPNRLVFPGGAVDRSDATAPAGVRTAGRRAGPAVQVGQAAPGAGPSPTPPHASWRRRPGLSLGRPPDAGRARLSLPGRDPARSSRSGSTPVSWRRTRPNWPARLPGQESWKTCAGIPYRSGAVPGTRAGDEGGAEAIGRHGWRFAAAGAPGAAARTGVQRPPLARGIGLGACRGRHPATGFPTRGGVAIVPP